MFKVALLVPALFSCTRGNAILLAQLEPTMLQTYASQILALLTAASTTIASHALLHIFFPTDP